MRHFQLTGIAISICFLVTTGPVAGQLVGMSHGRKRKAAPAQPLIPNKEGRVAPLLSGLGSHRMPITARSAEAKDYFNQGLLLSYGFNHAEAIRSFKQAALLDPDCAMAYWGMALAAGPNINSLMEDGAVPDAYASLQKAQALMEKTTPREQALIKALAKRYVPLPVRDRKPLDRAYAEAMREAAAQFGGDPDVLTLCAEAIMDTMPWAYWDREGKPNPGTNEALKMLEKAIELSPDHPGANHFYIHLTESSPTPERGLRSAYRLGGIAPGAGHLVHMPGHTFIRTGRYHEATLANQRAIEADNAYLTQCRRQGLYPAMYVPHNQHFLWASATIEGRSELAIKAARDMAATMDVKKMLEPGMTSHQHFWITPVYALARFGRWDEILQEPAPDAALVYPRAIWHYARGLAALRKGNLEQAQQEMAALEKAAGDEALKAVVFLDLNNMYEIANIAADMLRGEMAAARGDWDAAVRYLQQAAVREANLTYDEPPTWYLPVRQALGAVLLDAGRVAEAEKTFLEDLKQFPENGWSLYGLLQCSRQRGDSVKAAEYERRFREAWHYADISLTSARF